MRKLITSFVLVGVVMSSTFPMFANAQTLEANLKLIQDLSAQIKALQEQLLSLKKQQTDLQTKSDAAVVEIVQSLRQGSEGDQVKVLQALLAADPTLFPEGSITGYFGPATRRAIERFQRKNGLEAVGFVGPRTRAELNKWMREQFKEASKIDDDVAKDVEQAIASITLPALPSDACGIPAIPSGTPGMIKDGKTKIIQTGNVFIYQNGKHKIIITPNSYHEKDGKKQLLITPGMRIEKDGKYKSIIPCNGQGTTTPPISGSDTTPPVISSIASSASQTSATVSWKTDESATGKIYYGTTSPLNLGSAQSVVEGNWWWFGSGNTNHSVSLSGLSASTTYYFVIESKDKKGNTSTSTQQSFMTTAAADTVAPTLSAISTSGLSTSSATVNWTTNESSNSKVYYGTTTPINTGSALNVSNGSMVINHSLALSGLLPSTTYYFKVESKDTAGNGALSTEGSFTTLALPPSDTTAPVISATSATAAATSTTIAWTTNEAATSKVYYGTATPLNLGSASNVNDSTLMTSHSMMLSGLSTSTTYYYVIESKDAANNTATSSEASFTTTSGS